jgi:hypothetical protein
MKTSNKILLIFFVMATLLVTVVHVALYAKYKRGDYVSFDKIWEGRFEEHALPKVKYVSITGLNRCNILPAAESKIKIFKMKDTRLSYRISNDTLVIDGDSLVGKQGYENGIRNYQTINLYLPGNEAINVLYTGLFVNGSSDTTSAPSWQINLLNKSRLTADDFNNKKTFFNHLQINANRSTVTFNEETFINELSIQGSAAIITNHSSGIKQLHMSVDSTSTVILQGKSVNDIKFTKE